MLEMQSSPRRAREDPTCSSRLFEVSSLHPFFFSLESLFLMIFSTKTTLEMHNTCYCFQHNGKKSLRNKINGLNVCMYVYAPAYFYLSDDP